MKTDTTKSTPGPWELGHEGVDPEWYIITAPGGRIIANVHVETGNHVDEANCALILNACNNYERIKAENLKLRSRLGLTEDEDVL